MVRISKSMVTVAEVLTRPTTRNIKPKAKTLDVNPPSKKRCSVQLGISLISLPAYNIPLDNPADKGPKYAHIMTIIWNRKKTQCVDFKALFVHSYVGTRTNRTNVTRTKILS